MSGYSNNTGNNAPSGMMMQQYGGANMMLAPPQQQQFHYNGGGYAQPPVLGHHQQQQQQQQQYGNGSGAPNGIMYQSPPPPHHHQQQQPHYMAPPPHPAMQQQYYGGAPHYQQQPPIPSHAGGGGHMGPHGGYAQPHHSNAAPSTNAPPPRRGNGAPANNSSAAGQPAPSNGRVNNNPRNPRIAAMPTNAGSAASKAHGTPEGGHTGNPANNSGPSSFVGSSPNSAANPGSPNGPNAAAGTAPPDARSIIAGGLAITTPMSSEDPVVQRYRAASEAERNYFGLDAIAGHVLPFATDPEGSRALQRMISEASGLMTTLTRKGTVDMPTVKPPRVVISPQNTEKLRAVFAELEPRLQDVIFSTYGNFVIQKFIETQCCEFIVAVAGFCKGKAVMMAKDDFGCRILQNLVETQLMDGVGSVVAPHVVGLITEMSQPCEEDIYGMIINQNANHVLQRCMTFFPQETAFVAASVLPRFTDLAKHVYGSRVIQCIFEQMKAPHVTAADETIALKMMFLSLDHFDALVNTQYGNFAVTHALVNSPCEATDLSHITNTEGFPFPANEIRKRIVDTILPNIVSLSSSKFASNVAQRVFQFSSESQQRTFMDVLQQPQSRAGTPNIVALMMDQYANYVMQDVFVHCSEPQRAELLRCVRPYLTQISRSQFGRHIVGKTIGGMGAGGNNKQLRGNNGGGANAAPHHGHGQHSAGNGQYPHHHHHAPPAGFNSQHSGHIEYVNGHHHTHMMAPPPPPHPHGGGYGNMTMYPQQQQTPPQQHYGMHSGQMMPASYMPHPTMAGHTNNNGGGNTIIVHSNGGGRPGEMPMMMGGGGNGNGSNATTTTVYHHHIMAPSATGGYTNASLPPPMPTMQQHHHYNSSNGQQQQFANNNNNMMMMGGGGASNTKTMAVTVPTGEVQGLLDSLLATLDPTSSTGGGAQQQQQQGMYNSSNNTPNTAYYNGGGSPSNNGGGSGSVTPQQQHHASMPTTPMGANQQSITNASALRNSPPTVAVPYGNGSNGNVIPMMMQSSTNIANTTNNMSLMGGASSTTSSFAGIPTANGSYHHPPSMAAVSTPLGDNYGQQPAVAGGSW